MCFPFVFPRSGALPNIIQILKHVQKHTTNTTNTKQCRHILTNTKDTDTKWQTYTKHTQKLKHYIKTNKNKQNQQNNQHKQKITTTTTTTAKQQKQIRTQTTIAKQQ